MRCAAQAWLYFEPSKSVRRSQWASTWKTLSFGWTRWTPESGPRDGVLAAEREEDLAHPDDRLHGVAHRGEEVGGIGEHRDRRHRVDADLPVLLPQFLVEELDLVGGLDDRGRAVLRPFL